MRLVPVLLCLVAAGCATGPAASPPFHAPFASVAADPVVAAELEPLHVEGLSPVRAAPRAAAPVDDFEDRTVNLMVGMREFNDDDIEDLDLEDQWMLGVEMVAHDLDSGHGYEVGLQRSFEEKGSREAGLDDLYVGYRHTFHGTDIGDDPGDEGDVRPYLSAGASYARFEMDVPGDDDDSDLGWYVRAGVSWMLENDVRLSLDYRHLWAEFDLGPGSVDGDFDQLSLGVGFPF
jgi:hypothetical protein